MSAGTNGKLYGAVTNQTIADELAKLGFEVERKRIEVPGLTLKSVGKYTVIVHLYESATAEVPVVIEAQGAKEAKEAGKAEHSRKEAPVVEETPVAEEAPAVEEAAPAAEASAEETEADE